MNDINLNILQVIRMNNGEDVKLQVKLEQIPLGASLLSNFCFAQVQSIGNHSEPKTLYDVAQGLELGLGKTYKARFLTQTGNSEILIHIYL